MSSAARGRKSGLRLLRIISQPPLHCQPQKAEGALEHVSQMGLACFWWGLQGGVAKINGDA